ncbi:ABC transporter ATP-binding protein [Streptomyces sp. TRM68367]|uniref:ABC transporter ATP-binding protein n=1 Tax=Streptomyces sp. TRM68367 TaxID=2758415 RepID=UPI00165B33D1|nr:ABC transporter ATP-binding protein [Streptomyces sp. TRM68367]MBC9728770.1 ABC transporter ATP-binding protein [Streptomyces sp. TRM68367]
MTQRFEDERTASTTPAATAVDEPGDAEDVVLSVRDLEVVFPTALGDVQALNGVTFDVPRGKVLGIVGESGCGKSVTARAILRIVEKPGRITGGSITLHKPTGRAEITKLGSDSEPMRALRGKEIAMIFQEPMSSLNPVHTIGAQIEEAVLIHQTQDRKEAADRAVDMLRQVGMPDPAATAASYPHQLSGGMRQRAMIAMALSCHPTLLIADEPTTALDVTTEAQILELLRRVRDQAGMSIMFITHSMGVVAQLCDEVIVMYLGRIVERGSVDGLFHDPRHPYTRALLRSIPRIGGDRTAPLEVIEGSVPDPYTRVPGCAFHPRCPQALAGRCDTTVPTRTTVTPGHSVHCHLYETDRTEPTEAAK